MCCPQKTPIDAEKSHVYPQKSPTYTSLPSCSIVNRVFCGDTGIFSESTQMSPIYTHLQLYSFVNTGNVYPQMSHVYPQKSPIYT